MSCYWVAEVVPLAVTSFLPMIALPFLGVLSIKEVAPKYFADTNIVFFNSLMLSLAVEECQLHKRIALKMLTYVGTRPHWLMAGFMIITSFISLWISDTACCALMAPIAYALLEEIMIPKMSSLKDKEPSDDSENGEEKKLDTTRLSPRNRGICKCMMLLVAHASLIGGTGTINSTGPNLIFRDNLEK
uniref:Citrate transporter-like domain-containing protein n=1 Tax=Caenorhabditis japonica TaxID=281687 RepID=A0A8R1DKF7_CAEJA